MIKFLRNELLNYEKYYSNDVLNSEGRKIFEQIARICIICNFPMKSMIGKVRRKPTYENVLKFLSALDDAIRQLSE